MDSKNHPPIYLQLRELIRSKIQSGEYLPGTAIPSENELAKTYKLNRLTVRNALAALVYEGVLKRVRAKGIFVAGKKLERDLETLKGFTQTMLEKNVTPSRTILAKILRPAGPKYGQLFKINAGEEICYIKRLCCMNSAAVSLEEIFIPSRVLPNFMDIDFSVFTLYEIYDFYGIKLKYARQTLDMITLDQSDARILGIARTQPLMLFTCFSYDESDRIIEAARSYTRPDKCYFTVHFHR